MEIRISNTEDLGTAYGIAWICAGDLLAIIVMFTY